MRAASPYQPVASNNSVNTGLPQSSFQPQQPQQSLPVGYPSAPLPPSQPTIPQGSPFGGYTLPPTAANFPVSAYTNAAQMDKVTQEMMSQDSLNQLQNQQPNTPDLLMHRRQVRKKCSSKYWGQKLSEFILTDEEKIALKIKIILGPNILLKL